VDLARFPCLRLAYEAGKRGGTAPSVLVGADEQAVALFLRGELKLHEIAEALETVLARHRIVDDPDLATVLEVSEWAQDEVLRLRGLPPRARAVSAAPSGAVAGA
jgi:1-deoxy-D-xylulose-5-phosphate reductoisomerase